MFASAPTYAEAEERLIEAIQDEGGAMQAVMEFDPPLPKSTLDGKYSSPEIFLIGGDDQFETDAPRWKWSESAREVDERLRWLDAFYDQPVCRKCHYTCGRRNDKSVTLTFAPTKYDGAFGSFGTDNGPNHQIVSEGFLALLTPDEKHSLKFQPTTRKRGRKFFELVGPEGPPHVAVAGVKINGWRARSAIIARGAIGWKGWKSVLSLHDLTCQLPCAAYLRSVRFQRSSSLSPRLAGRNCLAKEGRAVLQLVRLGWCLNMKWCDVQSCRPTKSSLAESRLKKTKGSGVN